VKITILTFFPEIFNTYFDCSAPIKKAKGLGTIDIRVLQIRDFTKDKHRRCDDTPYGGGPGLVLQCQPIVDGLRSIKEEGRILFTSPTGRKFNHELAIELSREKHLIIVAGRYEGYDNRIFSLFKHEKISIGDYVITGGEPAGLIILDAVVRHIAGVLDNPDSLNEESFTEGFLEYDHYTKPRNYEGLEVPETLISGNHKEIFLLHKKQSLINTYENRPDLIKKKSLSENDLSILKEYIKEKYRYEH